MRALGDPNLRMVFSPLTYISHFNREENPYFLIKIFLVFFTGKLGPKMSALGQVRKYRIVCYSLFMIFLPFSNCVIQETLWSISPRALNS